jgi:hypothetical protein
VQERGAGVRKPKNVSCPTSAFPGCARVDNLKRFFIHISLPHKFLPQFRGPKMIGVKRLKAESSGRGDPLWLHLFVTHAPSR